MNLFNTSLARIAQEIPGATAVLNRYQLSFCCGGKHTLRDAAAEANLDPEKLHAELLELVEQPTEASDWTNASNQELINHLLVRFHQVHPQQLAELIRLSERVETVHGDKAQCPNGLAEHLKQIAVELDDHMQKEEQILFPMLAAGQGRMAVEPIHVMRTDHDNHALAMTRIDQLTNDITPPKGACNTWRALYSGLAAFKADLQQHIHLENDILFARNSATQGVAHV